MKKCSKECIPVCDFCKSYHDDGGEIRVPGNFVGEGDCDTLNKKVDAAGGRDCNEFICFKNK